MLNLAGAIRIANPCARFPGLVSSTRKMTQPGVGSAGLVSFPCGLLAPQTPGGLPQPFSSIPEPEDCGQST